MKTGALQRFRQKLANDQPVYGLWVTLESASITDIAVALGLDWVVIEAEHGHLDWQEINHHIRACLGTAGFERITRYQTATRTFGVGPGAEFIDYFNAELVPGIEMSGGFARFEPGGRLPAHLHDFDESICITRGDANCLVEGRHYLLNHCATAMVPRGRVHYFANESSDSMDMIWVYAGPMPERIVVDEACASQTSYPRNNNYD